MSRKSIEIIDPFVQLGDLIYLVNTDGSVNYSEEFKVIKLNNESQSFITAKNDQETIKLQKGEFALIID